jgi:hypothetical protein
LQESPDGNSVACIFNALAMGFAGSVAALAQMPYLLAVNPSVPANSALELINLGRIMDIP